MNENQYYTHINFFQKIGETKFPDINWKQLSDYPFYSNDKEFEIIIGTNTFGYEKEIMVVAFIDLEFETNKKIFTFEFPTGLSEVILKSVEVNFRKFSPFKRISILIATLEDLEKVNWDNLVEETRKGFVASIFIRNILRNITNSQSSALYFEHFVEKVEEIDVVFEELENLGLSKENLETLFDIESFLNKIEVSEGSEVNLLTLREILYMSGQTLDKENFKSFFTEFKSNFLLSDKTINQNYVFNNLMEYFWTAPAYRQKVITGRTYIPIEVYEIQNQIKNKFKTTEEMREFLKQVPFTKYPENLKIKKDPNFREEIIETSLIAGVYGHDNWLFDGKNVHMDTIFKYTRLFSNLGLSYSKGNPIKVVSYKEPGSLVDKYWVFHNGKYRISALLALGIEKIPVLVADGEVV